MALPFLGEIKMFGGNFAIRGWAFCNGSPLAISQNDALYALLGTTYGGDGVTTFNLPDLLGRVPIHMGQGPGLSPYVIGQKAGTETVTLTTNQIPTHTHAPSGSSAGAVGTSPAGGLFATVASGSPLYAPSSAGAAAPMAAQTLSTAGGSQPHNNLMPYQAVNFLIALEGVFPSRN